MNLAAYLRVRSEPNVHNLLLFIKLEALETQRLALQQCKGKQAYISPVYMREQTYGKTSVRACVHAMHRAQACKVGTESIVFRSPTTCAAPSCDKRGRCGSGGPEEHVHPYAWA